MIHAKPVIPDQYWILRKDDRKIGNIEIGPEGYSVKINNQVSSFKTLSMLKQRVKITFDPVIKTSESSTGNEIYGYHTDGVPYNAVYDVKHQVPLWTREPRSKSWYAAGWYRVRHGRSWSVVSCPKLITLERYEYRGPFHSKEQALES